MAHRSRIDRVLEKGYLFISADYRLLPEATGHDILEDVKDVFSFITKETTTFNDGKGGPVWKVKKDAIIASGASAGGFCAYLAAIHAEPKPISVLTIYGVGGDFFVRLDYHKAFGCAQSYCTGTILPPAERLSCTLERVRC